VPQQTITTIIANIIDPYTVTLTVVSMISIITLPITTSYVKKNVMRTKCSYTQDYLSRDRQQQMGTPVLWKSCTDAYQL